MTEVDKVFANADPSIDDELDFVLDEAVPTSEPRHGDSEPSFETALPIVRKQNKRAPRLPADTTPQSPEAERSLLYSISMYGREVISQAIAAGVTEEWFHSATRRLILKASFSVHKSDAPDCDGSTVMQELIHSGSGVGFADFAQETAGDGTSLQVSSAIETLRLYWQKRQLITLGLRLTEEGNSRGDSADALREIKVRVSALEAPDDRADDVRAVIRPITRFEIPSDTDTSILLGNRYLNRGDGAIVSAGSGMGKSSFSIQAAVTWSLGRPLFGIKPNGNLRSLIVQAEDSDGDVGEVWRSVQHGLKLTAEEVGLVQERVCVVTNRIHRGEAFIRFLRKLIKRFKPDLVWINPLFAFVDGNVMDAKDAGKFLREGLNGLNEPPSFGYVIVHHTNKPPSPKDRADRKWSEQMYELAGSAELTNWARAVISLRATDKEGAFDLILAKRGRRAGAVKEVVSQVSTRLEPTTTIPIRHSTDLIEVPGRSRPLHAIFWEPRIENAANDGEGADSAQKPGRGRPAKYPFEDFRAAFSSTLKGREKRQRFAVVQKTAQGVKNIPRGSFNDILDRWVSDGVIIRDDEDGRYYVR